MRRVCKDEEEIRPVGDSVSRNSLQGDSNGILVNNAHYCESDLNREGYGDRTESGWSSRGLVPPPPLKCCETGAADAQYKPTIVHRRVEKPYRINYMPIPRVIDAHLPGREQIHGAVTRRRDAIHSVTDP